MNYGSNEVCLICGNLADDDIFHAENRLIAATPLDPDSGLQKIELAYDFMSRRFRKTVLAYDGSAWNQEQERLLVYDGWNLLRETTTTDSRTLTEYYVWGLDLSGTLHGAGGIGGLLSWTNARGTFQYLYDANGNVSQLIDSSTGTIAAHYEYDPFGNVVFSTGSEAESNSIRFSTKYLDAEIGWYYYGHRYYDPVSGRWPTRDPIGERGGLNLYGFVGNHPVYAVDPYGLLQGLTVAVTAAGRDGGTFDGWGAHVAGRDRQSFTTGAAIINALREWTRTQGEGFADDKCTCIKNLYVFSHAWGYQSTWGQRHGGGFYSDGVGGGPAESGFYGKKSLYDHAEARNFNHLQADIHTGSIRFCSTCMITLTGCRVASTGTFASDLSRITGCTVRAAAGESSGENEPIWTSGPGDSDERQAEGGRPWQKFTPTITRDSQTGQEYITVTVQDIGGSLTLW